MKMLSAREAKNRFGNLIDTARQQPVLIEKHGRPVVVVRAIEEYERITKDNFSGLDTRSEQCLGHHFLCKQKGAKMKNLLGA